MKLNPVGSDYIFIDHDEGRKNKYGFINYQKGIYNQAFPKSNITWLNSNDFTEHLSCLN
jgi:hypothetical protein